VLEDTGLVLKCEIGTRVVSIPKLMIRGLAPLPGTHAAIQVLEWFAIDNQLAVSK
jgi:hypothetical protein